MAEHYWVGTSWKMNKTLGEALDFIDQLSSARFDDRITPFVIPPYTSVREVKSALEKTHVKVGAQNMHWAERGAWTGEISPAMLTDCNLDLVEIGHSERRTYFAETDKTVGLKTDAAIRHGLIPLICVGETEQDLDAGMADAILETQVRQALALASENPAVQESTILIAYEPVWAIGENGRPASPAYANERQKLISAVAEDVLGRKVPCLYGGSVNTTNTPELIREKYIDGLFIGRAAWEASGFINILDLCASCLEQS